MRLSHLLRRPRPDVPPADPWDADREFARLSAAVMTCTAEVLAAGLSADAVVRRYCDALVGASGHLPLAWCWFGAADTAVIRPAVCAGPAAAWASGLAIERGWLTARGPAYQALQGEPPEPFRVSRLSPWGPWRDAAADHGVRSVLCLPVPSRAADQRGVFVVYADRADYFDGLADFFEPVGELFGSILSRADETRALERAVGTDALTGLGNRHALARIGERLARRPGGRAAVIILDLDHFKRVNDGHGHAVGDRLLAAVADGLRRCIRRADDVVRLGGEEFVVVLEDATGPEAREVAEALRAGVAGLGLVLDDGRRLEVTATLGVATVRTGETLDAAIERADQALYAGKRSGRDRVVLAPEPD